MNTHKKLYRSNANKVFAGVIGGIGEYFDVDPTILRLVYVLITVMTGFLPALVAYIIAYFIVPEKPRYFSDATYSERPKETPNPSNGQVKKEEPKKEEIKTEEKVEEVKTEKLDI